MVAHASLLDDALATKRHADLVHHKHFREVEAHLVKPLQRDVVPLGHFDGVLVDFHGRRLGAPKTVKQLLLHPVDGDTLVLSECRVVPLDRSSLCRRVLGACS